ncbi:hypothetical protein FSPOR_11938 [Fusarium sporotrichioides]|uniref:Uncharacterized protein n=1 Tax=Fusarium sporotrichioides TaxID=5514 RepID=A0A395RCW0_FUSSP|nr:hypothetical protein FSPOR_11938 [Fusarium sporotrichioides]
MTTKRQITDLPAEIKQQIFREYFKAQGGYVYDGQSDKLRNADKTPIDLSLIYTCRSIANDCKRLPLAVNSIHFSTLYREDWRSLAGCFNFVATYYYVLQQDIVLHLAHLITPEMHAQLGKKFPNFRSKLEAERAFHFRVWDTSDRVRSDQDLDNTNTSNHMRPALCEFVWEFFEFNISRFGPDHRFASSFMGCAWVDGCAPNLPRDYQPDDCERAYRRWDDDSGEVCQCLTHCLQLIADENPEEFGNRVYTYLPHWVGKYPAKDFLDLRFERWAIPSQSQVENAMGRLAIPSFVWDLPNTWSYNWIYEDHDDYKKDIPPDQCLNDHESLPLEFDARAREVIRFSAAASAIRFLGLLSDTQRTQIRTLILHEDSPSVNRMSLHVNGLVPFLRENPLLRIERRVNVVNTIDITGTYGDGSQIASNWVNECCEVFLTDDTMIESISPWLIDAVSIYNEDIPAGSVTLLLESHPFSEFCTEAFQQLIHRRIAWGQAMRECLEEGLLKHLTGIQVEALKRQFTFGNGFKEAIAHLVNQTSMVLRCDFNPGVPEGCQTTVDEVRAYPPADVWDYWKTKLFGYSYVDLPEPWTRESIAKTYEIETQDEYLRSRARDSQQC